jgi:hypothetical protein
VTQRPRLAAFSANGRAHYGLVTDKGLFALY